MKRMLLSAGALLLAVGGSANAQMSMPAGLYVRLDVGGAISTDTSFTDVNPNAVNAVAGPGGSFSGDSGTSVIVGGGVGYRFSPMFRADLTLSDIPSLKFNGTANAAALAFSGLNTVSADVDSLVGMANGYVDLNGVWPNMFGAFQPYVGFGIGFANNEAGRVTSPQGGGGSVSSASNTDFAWGITAGVAYPITPQLSVDFAYKYLDLGDLRSGTTLTVAGGGGVTVPVQAQTAGLQVHTITLGLRYSF